MSKPLYFKAKSIGMSRREDRKPQSLLVAARHNLRDLQAEYGAPDNIFLELSHRNVTLHGPSSPKEVVELANALKIKYAVPKRKLRKDHVQALEFVISVRSDFDFDALDYFKTSLRWLISVFGEELLLSAILHLDESEPHMHVLVLPMVAGEYVGGDPIGRRKLPKLVRSFADQVGQRYGLSFEPKQRLSATLRNAALNLVVERLLELSDPITTSHVWGAVLESIKQAPEKFLEALDLKMPILRKKGMKTMAEIFTGTGKRTSEDRDYRAHQDLSSVGFR
jgi:hypothetical protein